MVKIENLRVCRHIVPGNQECIQSQFFITSGAQNDFVNDDAKNLPTKCFVNIVAKSWKIKQNNRIQSKSDTIYGGNRRKEASFEKKAESTEKMK